MNFKLKKGPESVLKIEGQEFKGTVRFNQANLMDICHKGCKVGYVVVEYLNK